MVSKFKVIPLHIYPFDVCVSINQTDAQVLKDLENNGDESNWDLLVNLPSTCLGRAVISPSNLSVIRFSVGKEIPHSVIAHEIFHIATFIMSRVGMKLKLMVSDEAYAYLIGYLTDEVYKILKTK